MFYDVHKENMFTINLEDGREAPSKARKKGAKRLEFLVIYTLEAVAVEQTVETSLDSLQSRIRFFFFLLSHQKLDQQIKLDSFGKSF